jgi:hypothetical protein
VSPAAIDRERQVHMATIARARSLGEQGNALLDKAQSLLTAHWGVATWDSRAAILKTVEWLLGAALHNPQPTPKPRLRHLLSGPASLRR